MKLSAGLMQNPRSILILKNQLSQQKAGRLANLEKLYVKSVTLIRETVNVRVFFFYQILSIYKSENLSVR